jgi:outer membrane protein assembly factor BamB
VPSTRRGLLATAGVLTAAFAGCTAVRQSPIGDAVRDPPTRRVDPAWQPGPGTWADDGYATGNTGHNPHATPPRTQPTEAWRHTLPTPSISLIVADGQVYCSTRRRIVALDAATGEVRWTRNVGAPTSLRYVDGRIYLTNTDEEIAALSPDGTEQWRTAVEAAALKDFHEQSGYVFLGTFSGHRILHADTGTVVRSGGDAWEFLASAGGDLYTTKGSSPGTPVAYDLDRRSIEERWRVATDCAVGRPAATGERVYYPVGSADSLDCDGPNRLWAFGSGGERLWTVTVAGDAGYPAVAEGRLFFSTTADQALRGRVVRLGPEGHRDWTHEATGGFTPPIVAGGTVYLTPARDSEAPLTALDATTGERLWDRPISRTPEVAAAGETLYVGDDDGIAALRE